MAELEAERLSIVRESLTKQVVDFILPMLPEDAQSKIRKLDDAHYHTGYQVSQLVAVLNAKYPLPRNAPPSGAITLSQEEIDRIRSEADRRRSYAPLHAMIGRAGPPDAGSEYRPDVRQWEDQQKRDAAELEEMATEDTGLPPRQGSAGGPGVHKRGGVVI